jgi:hypothetical protein
MICGTLIEAAGDLWDRGVLPPDRQTWENGLVAGLRVVLPDIHTPYVLLQEVL